MDNNNMTEYTFQDVAEHNHKKDCFLVIHEKVYDVTKFVDEHPGGEEVVLDMAGQDATEAFEDVGHSDEARETLAKLQVGVLKRNPNDPPPKHQAALSSGLSRSNLSSSTSNGMSMMYYLIMLLGAAAAYFGYTYMQKEGAAVKKHTFT